MDNPTPDEIFPPVEVRRFFSMIVAAGDDVRNPHQENIAHAVKWNAG